MDILDLIRNKLNILVIFGMDPHAYTVSNGQFTGNSRARFLADLKIGYRRLAQSLHPDKFAEYPAEIGNLAQTAFQEQGPFRVDLENAASGDGTGVASYVGYLQQFYCKPVPLAGRIEALLGFAEHMGGYVKRVKEMEREKTAAELRARDAVTSLDLIKRDDNFAQTMLKIEVGAARLENERLMGRVADLEAALNLRERYLDDSARYMRDIRMQAWNGRYDEARATISALTASRSQINDLAARAISDELLQGVDRLIASRAYADANSLIGLSLLANKNNPWSHYTLGELHFAQGNNDLAIAGYEAANTSGPGNSKINTRLGFAYRAVGRNADALRAFEVASTDAQQNQDPWVHYAFGELLLNAGRIDEAVVELGKANELKGDDTYIKLRVGQAWEAKGWTNEAKWAYEEAVRLDPANTYATAELARLQTPRS